MSRLKHFNIRVYGLMIDSKQNILLSDEYMLNRYMTKFPGGGLHFGEGPEDCILREAMEEFKQEAEIIRHFYTTGFFQKALFYEDHQLISIYYQIKLKTTPLFRMSENPFDFTAPINGSQSFRWASIENMKEEDLTFPVDKHVLKLLKKEFVSDTMM